LRPPPIPCSDEMNSSSETELFDVSLDVRPGIYYGFLFTGLTISLKKIKHKNVSDATSDPLWSLKIDPRDLKNGVRGPLRGLPGPSREPPQGGTRNRLPSEPRLWGYASSENHFFYVFLDPQSQVQSQVSGSWGRVGIGGTGGWGQCGGGKNPKLDLRIPNSKGAGIDYP